MLDSFDADATVRALVRHRIAFSDLEVTGACLEEAFLALTRHDRTVDSRGCPSRTVDSRTVDSRTLDTRIVESHAVATRAAG
jgi:ABC-2 type transport system ATP-binding protein